MWIKIILTSWAGAIIKRIVKAYKMVEVSCNTSGLTQNFPILFALTFCCLRYDIVMWYDVIVGWCGMLPYN